MVGNGYRASANLQVNPAAETADRAVCAGLMFIRFAAESVSEKKLNR